MTREACTAKHTRFLTALSIVLAVALMAPVCAFADANVCYNEGTGTGYTTLAGAVQEAEDGATIVITSDLYVDSQITIEKNLTIKGATGSEMIRRDTSVNTGALLLVKSGSFIEVSLQNLIVDGGAVWSTDEPTAAAAKSRTDSAAPAQGAPLVLRPGASLDLQGVTVQNCDTFRTSWAYQAGAIFVDCQVSSSFNAALSMEDSRIVNCTAGGKVYSEAGGIAAITYHGTSRIDVTLDNVVVEGCAGLESVDNVAGGMFLAGCTTEITGDSRIQGNYSGNGSAFTQRAGTCVLGGNTVVSGNLSDDWSGEGDYGSGIILAYTAAQLTIGDSVEICDNEARDGGAVFVSGNINFEAPSSLTVSGNATIHDNDASYAGGAIALARCVECSIGPDAEIADNTAQYGGGIVSYESSNLSHLDIEGSVYNNKASAAGSDIFINNVDWENIVEIPVASAMNKEYIDEDGNSYVIENWFDDQAGNRFDAEDNVTQTYPFKKSTSSLCLIAAGTKIYQYQVAFEMNGHGTQIDTQMVYKGATASKPDDPAEDGWGFTGWFADESLSEPFDFAGTPIMANTTVYAGWEEATTPEPEPEPEPTPQPTPEPTPQPTDPGVPETGDSAGYLWAVAALLVLAACVLATSRAARNRRESI